MADLVRIELDDHGEGKVARVAMVFDGPLHILNTAGMDAFINAFDELALEPRLRAVVLRGATDRAFIGGADIKEMVNLEPESAKAFITRLHAMNGAIRDLPVPVIARISGYCLGGGLEAAAACDLRAASTDAHFGMPEVHVGIPSVIEAALLPQLVGWGKTRELVYTGRILDAAEALQCGLVDRAAPIDELDGVVDEWLAGILRSGPRAIRLQKALIRRWETLPPDKAVEAGIEVFGQAYETDEPVRLMRGFLERKRGRG